MSFVRTEQRDKGARLARDGGEWEEGWNDFQPLGTSDGWDIRVRYRTEQEERNPLDRRPKVSLSGEEVAVDVFEDDGGLPILSSAGRLIVGLTETINLYAFDVEVNLPGYPRWLIENENAVNADALRICGLTIDPGRLWLRMPRIGARAEQEIGPNDTAVYYPTQFQLLYDPRTRVQRYYDRDLCELEQSQEPAPTDDDPDATRTVTRRVRIREDDGEPVDEPQFLDGKGRRPRILVPVRVKNPVTGEEEDGQVEQVKWPLEPSDFVVRER